MRETGYYWCLLNGKWIIAYYFSEDSGDKWHTVYKWESPELDLKFNDDECDEIDKKQIKRE
jgi:hypothetical protein